MLMRDTRDFLMLCYPFTLVRIEVTTIVGAPVHRRPLWLPVTSAQWVKSHVSCHLTSHLVHANMLSGLWLKLDRGELGRW